MLDFSLTPSSLLFWLSRPTHCEFEGAPCWISHVATGSYYVGLKRAPMPRTNNVFIRFRLLEAEEKESGGKKKTRIYLGKLMKREGC